MKLHLLFLSSALFASYCPAMLRNSTRYVPCHQVRPLRPIATRRVLTPLEIEKLKTQQAEQKAHNLQQEVHFLKQRLQHCQRNGCTQACLAHMKKNCRQIHQEKYEEAKQAFYKQQALDHRLASANSLRPTAQK